MTYKTETNIFIIIVKSDHAKYLRFKLRNKNRGTNKQNGSLFPITN